MRIVAYLYIGTMWQVQKLFPAALKMAYQIEIVEELCVLFQIGCGSRHFQQPQGEGIAKILTFILRLQPELLSHYDYSNFNSTALN